MLSKEELQKIIEENDLAIEANDAEIEQYNNETDELLDGVIVGVDNVSFEG